MENLFSEEHEELNYDCFLYAYAKSFEHIVNGLIYFSFQHFS